MMVARVRYQLEKIGILAKKFDVVNDRKVGQSIIINDTSCICTHSASTGQKRFKCVETGEVYTYERSEMKKARKAYETLQKIDDLLKQEGY